MKKVITKRRRESWRIEGELIAARLLDDIVPVPKPLEYSLGGELPYLVYERLPGDPIINRHDLETSAGLWLAKIHTVSFRSAGRISLETLHPDNRSWKDFFRDIYNFDLMRLEKTSFKEFAKKLRDWLDLQEVPETYSFLHVDYAPKNILADKELTGIIDFEFSCSGDPLYDLAWALLAFGAYEHSQPLIETELCKGYQKLAALPTHTERIIDVYTVAHFARFLRTGDYKATGKAYFYKLGAKVNTIIAQKTR